MNSLLKKLTLGVLFSALSVLGIAACTHHTPEERAEWITSHVSSKLDLNTDQKAKLEAIKQTVLDIRKSHQADREKHLGDVKELILSDKLDSVKVKSLIAQRQKVIDDNFDSVFAKVATFHASLTPQQKQKAVEMIEKFSEHWDH